MSDKLIGILDSGIGGLSVWREIIRKLPQESIIYLADSKNCPYGEKTEKEIYRLSKRLIEFLLKQKVKLIVIACNTITVTCLDKLRKNFPKIPIVGIVPVVRTASRLTRNGRIGILSTKQTARSKYQKDLIKKFAQNLKVLNLGTDRLVPLIEVGVDSAACHVADAQSASADLRDPRFESTPRKILEKELKPFLDFKIDVLALGCSHFPFLTKEMRKILGKKVKILDSGGAVARQVKRVLENNNLLSHSKPKYLFYTTGTPEEFKKIAVKSLGNRYIKMIKSAKRISL